MLAIGALMLVGFLIINNKLRRGLAFVMRAALGVAAVAAINFALGGFVPAVGINLLTIAVVAFLGIPGIIMLYGLSFFM